MSDTAEKLRKVHGVVSVTPMIEGQVMVTARGIAQGAVVRGLRPDDLAKRKIVADNIQSGTLAAFGYSCLHYLTYLWLEHFFEWELIFEDVLERRYVTAGFAALLCMTPLAATSTRAMTRRLGKRWNTLHRLAYAAGVLGVVHFIWLVKADLLEPLVYAAVLSVLFGVRIWLRATRSGTGKSAAPSTRT